MMRADDTIFALASGAGRGAISIVRVSGSHAGHILAALCGALPPPRFASLRSLRNGGGKLLDRGLVIWMPGPGSYTGEDMAELHLHGGRAVLAAITAALLEEGARPAEAGEFTRRAFMAGKMDLLEAEAIADLVSAETEAQRLQALRALEGAPRKLIDGWADRVRHALGFQEALVDFPDENLPPDVEARLQCELESLVATFSQHAELAGRTARQRDGLAFIIIGAPNAGKSSLLNALAGEEIAIVSTIPGTTRDTISCDILIDGIAVTLIDTAGLRETEDAIEAEGVRRARAKAAAADLIIEVIDAEWPAPQSDAARHLRVTNKIDLSSALPGSLGISVRTGEGLEQLRAALREHALSLAASGAEPILTRARHAQRLQEAAHAITRARESPLPELRAEELRCALGALGAIVGETSTEDVLDVIFGSFCIGK